MLRSLLRNFSRSTAVASLTFAILCFAACDQKGSESESKTESTEKKAEQAAIARPEKGAIAHVPVGKFSVGSMPGEPGRDPSLEPVRTERELGPFRIDVYPYPGDPDAAPRVGVSQEEATALCAQKNGRLCTELEWERACRGPSSAMYPSGSEPCKKDDDLCQSGFDVAQMTSLPEWTSSHFGKNSDHQGAAVVRGAHSSLPSSERRCARRSPHDKKKDEPVGFRCCYGAPNAASFSEPTLGPAYEEVEIDKAELKKLLAQDERTKHLAEQEVIAFKPETARTVLARGPGDTMGFTLTTNAVKWQPVRGSRFFVVAGRSGEKTSFVLAYFLAGDQKTLAGSFIMDNEPGPIALAYANSIRPRIHFSGCWGCPGETGKVLFRPPEELVMLQP